MTQYDDHERTIRDGSFFWPVVLIGIGVVALLVNYGHLPSENLWGLLSLWPLLLVLGGLDLIFSRRRPAVGGLLGLMLVGVVVWLMYTGRVPTSATEAFSIGGLHINASPADVQRDHYVEPLAGAERADVALKLRHYDTEIDALPRDSDNLLEATIDHTGQVWFSTLGEAERSVSLSADTTSFSLGSIASGHRWRVSLTRRVPIALDIEMSSGDLAMDLTSAMLQRLGLRGGAGEVDALLPGGAYDLSYKGGSGDVTLDVLARAEGDYELTMGSGDVQIRLGDDANVRIVQRLGGAGDLHLSVPPGTPLQVSVENTGAGRVVTPNKLATLEDGRLWQSDDYAGAARRVTVAIERMGSGDVIVNYR